MCQSLARINVLVVDDDPIQTDLIKEIILEQNIYNVTVFNNCVDTIESFKPKLYCIAFIDLHLDGSINNGINLISNIRNQDEDIFIVLVSAYPELVYNKILIECVDDFIKKPFDIDFFLSKLFLWSTKYERRQKILKKIDSRCNSFEDRMLKYECKLNDIRKIDLEIEELTERISRYHPMENYGEIG